MTIRMRALFDIVLLLPLIALGYCWNAANTAIFVDADPLTAVNESSLRRRQNRHLQGCKSVFDIICGLQNTQTMCALVKEAIEEDAALKIDLEGESIKEFTVFVPIDSAFEAVEAQWERLSNEERQRSVLFHFYPNVIRDYNELECSSVLTSLSRDTSRTKCVRRDPGDYQKNQRGKGNKELDEYPSIQQDTARNACSGIVHRIEGVMFPETFESLQKPVTLQPLETPVEPTEAPVEPTESPVEPTESPVEPTESPVVPTEAPVEPTAAPVEPTEAPVEPTETPEEPTEAPEEPTDVPVAPTDPPVIVTTNDPVQPTDAPIQPTFVPEPDPPKKKKPVIGALGINLILFSTLLLCFVFVCMRR